MKRLQALLLVLALCLPFSVFTQYNLEEFGIEGGPGFLLHKDVTALGWGPAANVNAFFSHYACGKGYGFHLNAGVTGSFPSIDDGSKMTDLIAAGKTQFQMIGLDLAVLGKLRIHEYHRPREWAVFAGPRLQVPLVMQYATADFSGSVKSVTEKVSRVWPGVELSVQFRQPASKKKSWFIHPGAAYFFTPTFKAHGQLGPKPLYLFLNFGYALWDARG